MKTNYQENKVELIIFILVVNFIIALTYLVIKYIKKDLKCGIMMSIFMIICPVVGPLYLFFSWFVYEIYFKRRKMNISIEEISFKKERIKVISKPDMNSALNKVPLEEAFIVSDKKSARKLLIDVLKEDSSGFLNAIFKGIENEDSEVSHYAASAISDIFSEFKVREKELRENYNEDKRNRELCNEYMDYLYDFLSQKILSSAEQEFYCGLFEELIITIEKYLPSEVSGELYNKLVCIFLDLGENHKAKVWVDRALADKGKELFSYKAALRYYYVNEDRSEFLSLIKELKKSDVHLDQEVLKMVRFFSQ